MDWKSEPPGPKRSGTGGNSSNGMPRDDSHRGAPAQAIEVSNIRPLTKGGNVRAFLDLRIGGVTIRGAKVVMQAGQRPWLAMPDRTWTGDDGKPRYTSVVELSDSLRKRANDAAIAAWETSDGRS